MSLNYPRQHQGTNKNPLPACKQFVTESVTVINYTKLLSSSWAKRYLQERNIEGWFNNPLGWILSPGKFAKLITIIDKHYHPTLWSLCCSFQHWDLILPFICWIRSCHELDVDVFPQSVKYGWMLNLEVSNSVPSLPKQRYWSWVSKQSLPPSARILCAVAFQWSEYSVPAEIVPHFADGN